ncbi:hypothetical protein, partial [Streptomyces sp. NPDC057682]|uniref:hypothetical protein n=1 Tax=Streptomyces sp. NPDC057682 TaxID=3346210 RepID=UPI00368CA1D7
PVRAPPRIGPPPPAPGAPPAGAAAAARGASRPVVLVDAGSAAPRGAVVRAPTRAPHLCCQVMHGTREGGRSM